MISQSNDIFRDTLCLERVQNAATNATAPVDCMSDLLCAGAERHRRVALLDHAPLGTSRNGSG